MTGFVPQPFPISDSLLLSPYWGDVDTTGTGDVRYRQTNDPALLTIARNDVLSVYPTFTLFTPTNLLIATWDAVGYFQAGTDLVSCSMIPLRSVNTIRKCILSALFESGIISFYNA